MSNIASGPTCAHNLSMHLGEIFAAFLQPVAIGSAAVFVLLGILRLRIPHRSPALALRKTLR